jgi:hypothetical protein
MSRKRVLWIEDNAYTENTMLAAPVHLSGIYDLTIALNATQGTHHLRRSDFEAVIVDIRIPPGDDDRWDSIYRGLFESNKAARLGLKLLDVLLGPIDSTWSDFPASARDRSRYGVLSVESGSEFRAELERLGIEVYRDKAGGRDPRLLLEMIDDIIKRRGAGVASVP